MSRLLIVGEDRLCCSLGRRIVNETMPGWQVHDAVALGGITKLLPALPRYAEQAAHVRPVLCIADTDDQCPVDLKRDHMPQNSPPGLLLRFAVPEAECWVLADRVALASYFQVSADRISKEPEDLVDAKQEVLMLAKRSKVRRIREEVIAGGHPLRPGSGYNAHLCDLVASEWNPVRAAKNSPSLQRAIAKIGDFAARYSG